MTIIRSDPKNLKLPALRRQLIVYPHREQLVAATWPKKRGPPTDPATKAQNSWFTWSNRASGFVATPQWEIANSAAKGRGKYPRDLLTAGMAGTLYDIQNDAGDFMFTRKDQIEVTMFQGVILRLASNISLPANTQIAPNWPTPLIDTASFWNAGQPKRITIPTGVNVVEFNTGGRILNDAATRFILAIRANGVTPRALMDKQNSGTQGATTSTGPIPVTPGDYFEALYLTVLARTLEGSAGDTFFSMKVLGATL
jgi:hypothetical protein